MSVLIALAKQHLIATKREQLSHQFRGNENFHWCQLLHGCKPFAKHINVLGSQLFLAFKISLREQDKRTFYKSFTFPKTQNKKKQIKTIMLDQSSITLMNRFKQYFQISQSKILINIWQHSKDVPQWGNTWKWNIYLKGTNFCTYLISRVEKKIHFCTNFREWSFTKRFEGINFRESRFYCCCCCCCFCCCCCCCCCWWLTASCCRWAWFKLGLKFRVRWQQR